MKPYEIRILKSFGSPTIISAENHLNDESALRSGQRLADGRQFEVWRGDIRIHPEAPPSNSLWRQMILANGTERNNHPSN
jgi:hypothetical protein